jgi:phosphatidylserine/phosphatidylglycerophosphate/cardiolipin synthase-like enzyme
LIIEQIDDRVVIAHNKIMVIDDRNVITGSFNFTKAAQRNAENVLFVIDDMALAAAYKENWMRRAAASRSLGHFRAGRPRWLPRRVLPDKRLPRAVPR